MGKLVRYLGNEEQTQLQRINTKKYNIEKEGQLPQIWNQVRVKQSPICLDSIKKDLAMIRSEKPAQWLTCKRKGQLQVPTPVLTNCNIK